jgi:hypothetical protein
VRPLDAQIISPPVPPSEMTDHQLGSTAARFHEQAVASADSAKEAAARAGELLLEGQRRCAERSQSFADWLLRYWPKSDKTAYRYIALAQASLTEVQKNSLPRAGEGNAGLASLPLAHPSVRAALEAIGYDAGGTREKGGETEDEAIERLAREREDERHERKAGRHARADEPATTPARGGGGGGLSSPLTPEEQARRAEASRKIAEERAALEAASKRDPLVPPENPHQVGRPKPPEPAPDPEATCNAADLREIADLLDALSRDAWSALSRLNAVRFAPVHDDDGRRDAEITQAREAVAALAESAGNVAKKRGHQLRELANVEARVIGLERERRHKEAKKARRGA